MILRSVYGSKGKIRSRNVLPSIHSRSAGSFIFRTMPSYTSTARPRSAMPPSMSLPSTYMASREIDASGGSGKMNVPSTRLGLGLRKV